MKFITIKLNTPLNQQSICCKEKILQVVWQDTHVFLSNSNDILIYVLE